MFAQTARLLLTAVNKACTAQGTFNHDEMLPAAAALRQAVVANEAAQAIENSKKAEAKEALEKIQEISETKKTDENEETDGSEEKHSIDEEAVQEAPVTFRNRAWPLIDMLERTAKSGKKANIVWQAAGDF